MSKYIVQHRRGTAAQWAEKDTIIPMEGELVIEIDEENAQHKLKIGDGIHTYAALAYLQAGDEIITQALAKVLPRVVTVTLDVDQWVEVTSETDPNLGYYKQTVTLDGITARSRLDLQPNVDMLAEFQSLNLVFTTENKNSVITVYSVGDMPLKSYTMQATIVETEIIVESEQVVGIPVGTPTAKSDWAQTDETKADYIKNKPENLATTDYVDEKVAEAGGNITLGEFLEFDEDGELNVVPYYDVPSGVDIITGQMDYISDNIIEGYEVVIIHPKHPISGILFINGEDASGYTYHTYPDGSVAIWNEEALSAYLEQPVTVEYYHDDYTKELIPDYTKHAGKFISIDNNNDINIVTSYEYDAGTITEIETTTSDDYNYDGYFKPKYPIKEIISVKSVRITDNQDWTWQPDYELQEDGTLYIHVDTYNQPVSILITYTYDAGTRSLFDELDIPDTTIDTKIENGVLYIKYGDSEEYTEVGKVVGEGGVGISSIEKTGSEGLVDTYTVTYTDETTTTFTVTNGKDGDVGDSGNGISDISKTSTEGLVDTYTITFTDNSTTTFDVTNGKDGEKGESGVYVGSGEMPEGCIIQVDLDGDPDEFYKEEWINLADITLEEVVSHVAFNKDVNSKSFAVKRLVADVYLPDKLLSNSINVSPSITFNWSLYLGDNLVVDTCRRIYIDMKVAEGKFTEITMFYNGSQRTFWADVLNPCAKAIFQNGNLISAFWIGGFDSDTTPIFPVGTKMKVWGLKA